MTVKHTHKTKNNEPMDITVPKLNRDKKVVIPPYKDVEMVRGIFRNLESPGLGISFPYRGGWKGPIKQFTFFDGVEKTIPRELADHLNNNCAYKKMKWVSADGTETVNARPITTSSMPNFTPKVDKEIHRFMFQITG